MLTKMESKWGFKPTSRSPHPLSKKKIDEYLVYEAGLFFARFQGHVILDWWPRHPTNGMPLTHVWRVIDEVYGSDMYTPDKIAKELEDDLINFKDPEILKHRMLHISPSSAGRTPNDQHKRPFISTSGDIANSLIWSDKKRDRAKRKKMVCARCTNCTH